jgi:hypothetical protein
MSTANWSARTQSAAADDPTPARSERLAERAVTLADDPSVSARDLAAILALLAEYSTVVLESTLQRVRRRDPDEANATNTRAAVGLRLAISQHLMDHPPSRDEGPPSGTCTRSGGLRSL